MGLPIDSKMAINGQISTELWPFKDLPLLLHTLDENHNGHASLYGIFESWLHII